MPENAKQESKCSCHNCKTFILAVFVQQKYNTMQKWQFTMNQTHLHLTLRAHACDYIYEHTTVAVYFKHLEAYACDYIYEQTTVTLYLKPLEA